jgi:Flp pilus assembly protein TadG
MTPISAMPRGSTLQHGWDEGATAVEGALIISVMVFLIFGIIEFGITLWNWNTMVLAVGDAGRYVMINNTTCGTTCAVGQMQTTLATAPGTVSTTCTTPAADQICLSANTTAGTAPNPSTMTLTAAYGFKVIGLSPTYTLTSQATFPLD